MVDACTEMHIADALEEIQTRNACHEQTFRTNGGHAMAGAELQDGKTAAELRREAEEREDEEAAKRAFGRVRLISEERNKQKENTGSPG